MKKVLITFKTDSKTKAEAKRIAAELGFSLSALLNAYLKHFIKSKTIFFSLKYKTVQECLEAVKKDKN